MERITILGMGPIGVTIGLGLKRAKLQNTEIVGTDGDSKALKRAVQMGAIDTANGNLRSSIYGASLVIMDTPHSETREFLEAIGPIVGQDTTVTDTGSAKVQVAEWARQYLPHDASYVGGRPLPKRTMYTLDDVRPDVARRDRVLHRRREHGEPRGGPDRDRARRGDRSEARLLEPRGA